MRQGTVMRVTKWLEQTKRGTRVKPTKSEKARSFALPASALDALREHKLLQGRDKELFGPAYQDNELV